MSEDKLGTDKFSPTAATEISQLRSGISQIYPYKCDRCIASFLYTHQLKQHQEKHDKNTGVSCPLCSRLMNRGNLKKHLRYHAKPTYNCHLCPAKFGTTRYFERHLKFHKSKQQSTNCQKCGVFMLVIHERFHRCRKRDSVTNTTASVIKQNMPYYCDDCHMIYTSVSLLRDHRKYHHANVPNLCCPHCDASGIETKQLLDIHIKYTHPQLVPQESMQKAEKESLQCPHCPESFETSPTRDYHIAKFHRDMLLTCECGFKAKNFSVYLIHKRRV